MVDLRIGNLVLSLDSKSEAEQLAVQNERPVGVARKTSSKDERGPGYWRRDG